MAKTQRTRGATTEREIANYLSDELGFVVKRNLSQARDSGEDITCGQYRIEVKRRKKLAVMDFMLQVEKGKLDGQIPLVVMRMDGDKRPLVMLRLEDFVPLMRESL